MSDVNVRHTLNVNGEEIGRGISFYDGLWVNHIKGMKTREIEKLLGIDYEYETVIHRDNMSVKIK